MRRVAVALACAVVAAVLPAPALAQAPSNGQLAVVQRDRIVAINADGSAPRTLYAPGSGDLITDPVWSPDGNRLAFVYQRKIAVLDVNTRATEFLTQPGDGNDLDPAWLDDGTIGFRRIPANVLAKQQRLRVNLSRDVLSTRDFSLFTPSAIALWSNLETFAYRLGPALTWTGGGLDLSVFSAGTPAWSPRGTELAYVEQGGPPPPYPYRDGLRVVNLTGEGGNRLVVGPPAEGARWAPAGDQLTYIRDGDVMTVVATGENATPSAVPNVAAATAVAWQPCVDGVTVACRSVLPPVCAATAAQVTTQADMPVELPAAPCSDPAGLPLQIVGAAGEHGSVSGTLYIPRPGFVGQDTVSYRVSNGTAQSDPVRFTVFVVPRPAPTIPSGLNPSPSIAPYLSLRAKPKLDRKRTVLARLTCDQKCTFTVRLEARLKSKNKAIRGTRVKRTLEPGRVLALRLKLPSKPKGTLRRAWITGTVQGVGGAVRSVNLPVTPRR